MSQYPLLRFNTIQLIKNGSFTRTIWNYWRVYQEQPQFQGTFFKIWINAKNTEVNGKKDFKKYY
jgi:hypothetical protein